jgi:hypothetical protein
LVVSAIAGTMQVELAEGSPCPLRRADVVNGHQEQRDLIMLPDRIVWWSCWS